MPPNWPHFSGLQPALPPGLPEMSPGSLVPELGGWGSPQPPVGYGMGRFWVVLGYMAWTIPFCLREGDPSKSGGSWGGYGGRDGMGVLSS